MQIWYSKYSVLHYICDFKKSYRCGWYPHTAIFFTSGTQDFGVVMVGGEVQFWDMADLFQPGHPRYKHHPGFSSHQPHRNSFPDLFPHSCSSKRKTSVQCNKHSSLFRLTVGQSFSLLKPNFSLERSSGRYLWPKSLFLLTSSAIRLSNSYHSPCSALLPASLPCIPSQKRMSRCTQTHVRTHLSHLIPS